MGKVSPVGVLEVTESLIWDAELRRLAGKDVVLTIQGGNKRTSPQNRRHFGLLVPLAGSVLSLGLVIPLSKVQIHEVLCRVFLGEVETPLGPVRKESKGLSTAEFAAFNDRICHWLTQDHRIVIPDRFEEENQ